MRYRVGVIGLIGVAGLCVGTSLLACGDKFLVAGRGARFQRENTRVTVLIYAPPTSPLSAEIGKLSVTHVLSREGYRPATAASAEELGEILRDRSPDVVLVDIADARAVERHAPAGSFGPTILPVLQHATRKEVAEAKKTWGVALKSPASSDSLLDAVDEAAALHAKVTRNAALKR